MMALTVTQFSVLAKVSNDFSAPYGLIVHSDNQDLPVSRIKALEALLKYFDQNVAKLKLAPIGLSDIKPNTKSYDLVARGCFLNLFPCLKGQFSPYKDLSLNEFIDWFFHFKYNSYPNYLLKQYPDIKKESTRNWMEARRLNLINGEGLTYRIMQEFLYRHSVSEKYFGIPYHPALVLSEKEISPTNYHNLKEIEFIIQGLSDLIVQIKTERNLSPDKVKLIKQLNEELNDFEGLRGSLAADPYVLAEKPDLEPSIVNLVRQYDLQEVLYSYSYDYSHNPAYRKYNLVTGALKAHGKVLMPGEILDYWKLISDKNLWDFKYGWVIAEGKSQWLFGGGICGSATLLFIPVWKVGLEILERRNHSLFYSDLYPKENIGLDATIYRPKPNLKFRNNFDTPLVFNVIDDKAKQVLTVEILGNRNYKDLQIEGPIFVKKNVIQWVRHITGYDGKITSEALESRYSAIY